MHTILRRRIPYSPLRLGRLAAPSVAARLGQIAAQAFETLLVWQERASQRRALAQLDARMLQDVGLSRADVDLELRKPFWHA